MYDSSNIPICLPRIGRILQLCGRVRVRWGLETGWGGLLPSVCPQSFGRKPDALEPSPPSSWEARRTKRALDLPGFERTKFCSRQVLTKEIGS